jgi:hypothetical protein
VQPRDVIAVSSEICPQQRMISVDIADYFLMCQPVEGVRVIQSGDRRESMEVFMRRLENDLTPWHPTVVLTSYGVGNGREGKQGGGYTRYQPLYEGQMIDGLKKIGVRTIVVGSSACADSYYFHNNPAEAGPWNANLADFRDLDHQLADKAGVLFADIFGAMMAAMPKAKALYGDQYHFAANDSWEIFPTANGQLVMAYALLKALGCDGNIGAITVDLAANTAQGTPGQKILSAQNGVVEVESTRYPFCFQGDPKNFNATSGIIQCFPFNDELNRYLLVVHGLKTARAKVTWGKESREFAAADLEKGVNLADAFAAHTPFDGQFFKVESAVWAQQQPHLLYMQSYFHNIADFKQMAPRQTAAVDSLATAIIAQDQSQAAAAAALVVPIRHTLKIEALP